MPRKLLDPTDETCQVTVKLPTRQLDALRAEAERRGCSMSKVVRLKLHEAISRREPSPR